MRSTSEHTAPARRTRRSATGRGDWSSRHELIPPTARYLPLRRRAEHDTDRPRHDSAHWAARSRRTRWPAESVARFDATRPSDLCLARRWWRWLRPAMIRPMCTRYSAMPRCRTAVPVRRHTFTRRLARRLRGNAEGSAGGACEPELSGSARFARFSVLAQPKAGFASSMFCWVPVPADAHATESNTIVAQRFAPATPRSPRASSAAGAKADFVDRARRHPY